MEEFNIEFVYGLYKSINLMIDLFKLCKKMIEKWFQNSCVTCLRNKSLLRRKKSPFTHYYD